MKNKTIIPLPFPYYFIPVFLIALGGMADSIYLSVSHYRVYTDIGYSSFCAVSKSINCDTVSQSPFSIFLNVPVPIWGVLGYLGFTILLMQAWGERHNQKDGWSLLQLLALLFSIYSVILAFISTYFIHSYCIMCIVSYAINLMLLFYTWMIRNRFGLPLLKDGLVRDLKAIYSNPLAKWGCAAICIASLTGMLFFPPYWRYTVDLQSENIATGMTEDGHPWIGASNPELEIVEYTDFLCFQCRKMHYYLRKLVSQNPDHIRLVHRNFPMDHTVNAIVKEPFHVGSGNMALLAIYAAEKGKFWEMNDILFKASAKDENLNLSLLADETGLDVSEMHSALTRRTDLHLALAKDIWDGIKLGLTGTPAYIIKGKIHLGQIPPDILRGALE